MESPIPRPFHPFTPEHYLTVALGFTVVAIILLTGRKGGWPRDFTRRLLVVLTLSSYPLSLAAWATLSAPKALDNYLPFHLCDIATFTSAAALLTGRRLACALTYYWGLAATLQALLTPAITVGFPNLPFVMFFIQHFAIVATALYLPLVQGWRPSSPWWRTPWQVYRWSVAYLLFALAINSLLKTNFAFALHPPENPSLIDHLGPWPYYLASMLAIALLLFSLLTLPFVKILGQPRKTSEPS